MDDASQDLRIHIISDADNTGFKSMGSATEDLTEKVEKSEISHRELHKILLDIGNVSAPGAGRALAELAFGPIGAGLALVGVYEMFKKSLEDDEKAADALADKLAEPDTGGIEAVTKAWDGAKSKFAEYVAALSEAGKDKDPLQTQFNRIKAVEAATLESNKKLIESYGKVEEALVRSQGGNAQAVAAIHQRTDDAIASLEDSARVQTLDDLRALRASRVNHQPRLEADAGGAEIKSAVAGAAFNEAVAELEKLKKDGTGDYDKRVTAAADEAASQKQLQQNLLLANVQSPEAQAGIKASSDERIAQAQRELDAAQKLLDNRNRRVEQLEDRVNQLQAEKAEADKNFSAATAASTTNKNRIGELDNQIGTGSAVETAKQAGDAAVRAVESANNALTRDRATADAVTSGRSYSGADAQKMMADASKIAGHSVDLETAAKIIENGANNIGIFMNQVNRLAAAIGNFSPQNTDEMQRAIKLLLDQMKHITGTGFQ